jgi:kindlin 2
LYKSREESRSSAPPSVSINLRGCEVTPEVNLAQSKFHIKLEVPPEYGNGPNSEVWIRCDNEEQYAKWMAACRLAAKGRSLADSSYESEVSSIRSFLSMQKPAQAPAVNINPNNIHAGEYLAPRFAKKLKGKAANRMLEAHANVKDLSLIDAKLNYIKAWQSLPEYGVSLFVIKFDGHKKTCLLGIANNRIMQMDISTGDHVKTWRYNTMKVSFMNKHQLQLMKFNYLFIYLFTGVECKLGGETHDGSVRGRKHSILLSVMRLQSGTRVYRRLYFHVNALQGKQSNA